MIGKAATIWALRAATRPLRRLPTREIPWRPEPGDRKHEIVKAIALLEAEYERISRAEGKT